MTAARILVVNSGSSTVKLSVLDARDSVVHSHTVECPDDLPEHEVRDFVRRAGRLDAVGHRVVHGGSDFDAAVLLDPATVDRISALAPLAPLHQSRAVACVRTVGGLLPDLPAVACFDTAFHRSLPARASTYALPESWRTRWGLRRFGFHGLSHAYAARRACEIAGADASTARVVTCHLGSGASLAAVRAGASIDTTMGFTPAEGLVMATRAGDVDPGLLVWLQRRGVGLDDLDDALTHRSGMAGLAGHGGDMRAIAAAARDGDDRAILAREVYAYRVRTRIAGMAAALGGLDVLAFTGGVGEHDHDIREQAVCALDFLGVAVDPHANAAAHGDADIGAPDGAVRTVVVTAGEDIEIARQTRHLLDHDNRR